MLGIIAEPLNAIESRTPTSGTSASNQVSPFRCFIKMISSFSVYYNTVCAKNDFKFG